MEFPKAVKIVEVGPRDGFQNIEKWIPTELKKKVIDGLIKSNLEEIEITSFVHPNAIPQMKDAKEISQYTAENYKNAFTPIALVPNLYGAKKAFEAGIKEITYVISASEAHNKANVNRTVTESLDELREIKAQLPKMTIKLDIATVFGCSISGKVPVDDVINLINNGIEIGVDYICLCDTIGIANPTQVQQVLKQVKANCSDLNYDGLGLHFHNTMGMGLANILAAMDCEITVFESALGGLGGCPFAPGAPRNISTEELVYMLNSMDIKTNVDLEALKKTTSLLIEYKA